MNFLNEILMYFNENIQYVFNQIDEIILNKITEIRIRKNKPVILIIRNTSYFVDCNGDLYDYPSHNAVIVNAEEFDKLFLNLCDYSVYSSMDNMKKGFISLPNGSRVGIASTCVKESNELVSVKDVVSLNIRIHKEIEHCADKVLNFLYVNSFPSIIVAGAPNSGKTTLLRDIAFQLSNGFNNRYQKVAIIDERNEIAGKQNDDFSMNVGINADVLTGFSKANGIEIATRVLSPDMIVCDEISTIEEVESIEYAFSSGVAFALSVHLSSRQDLVNKPIIRKLLNTNEFSYIVLLKNHTYDTKIIDAGEILSEINRNECFDSFFNRCRNSSCFEIEKKI